ncbi:HNH endonuclease [Vibrio anguillarum]|uniref:HNH endonuclease n=1 Tax=Vibrio anguillarum TaxID=55601 RepID=A0ABR9Z7C3_VIBAN|nr:HNH endonuclease [Vibrio anguillarum]MBF4374371.1 HNH endonuclease [Vibrio anguillarum]
MRYDNTPLFIGVIRNINALSRNDNPNIDEDNEEYKTARTNYLTEYKVTHQSSTMQCESCHIEMTRGFNIHHKDGDHSNNAPSNFSIRCRLCHLCEHLGFVGQNNLGVVVYAPNLTQAQLNALQILVFSVRSLIGDTKKHSSDYEQLKPIHQQLDMLYRNLQSTSATVSRIYNTCDPLHFANAFLAMSEDDYQKRSETNYSGLRLLFNHASVEKEIEYWKQEMFQPDNKTKPQTHPSMWQSLFTIFNNNASSNL